MSDTPHDDAEATETIVVPPEAVGTRLDTFLGRRQSVHSRTFFQQLIKDGRVTMNDAPARGADLLVGGEKIVVRLPPPEAPWPQPQPIAVEILHHDRDIIIVNKAPGMVVHPAAGNPDGTLVNALLHQFPDLPGINGVKRPGLVHRLDRDTSGVMVVAKNDRSMGILSKALAQRLIRREYAAILLRDPDWEERTVDIPIGRHETFRIKRSVNGVAAKRAVTHLKVLLRARGFALVRCRLETGRTHQIRVHCEAIGAPIVGDNFYGGAIASAIEKLHNADSGTRAAIQKVNRPLLHARRLHFRHPGTGEDVTYIAPFPDDMALVMRALFPDYDPESLLLGAGDDFSTQAAPE
jgi:23S rRNA pseudouridine1911/1915/1917 synthase